MAQLYAALKMKMGSWTYYSVSMTMSQVANEIKFAHEVSDDKTLDKAIQRSIQLSRAGKQIVNYLVKNEQRIFNSLVVAALDGNPSFNEVKIDEGFALVKDMLPDTFGVLTFDDSLKTYALDGQHRLYAIQSLINGTTDSPHNRFRDERINVIFVVPSENTSRDDFLKAYRRLFSSLNRHAKPTDLNTNIIMDEDDRFAIVTRRLLSDFDFFSWDGVDENPRIDALKTSENIPANSSAWASLIGLYKMNILLLWDPKLQEIHGVYTNNHTFKQETPEDNEVDDLYEYLEKIWDAILINLPVLNNPPTTMRRAGSEGSADGEEQDNLLFRPIGQTSILAPICRLLLNHFDVNSTSDAQKFIDALKPLSYINWSLQWCLWRDLLSFKDPDGRWKMRNEDRQRAVEIGNRALQWVIGNVNLDDDQLADLKQDWSYWIITDEPRDEREEETFKELNELREKIINECY